MYGRGSTDDKGPVLGWLNVLQAHKAAGTELPVNLLMCFEGMEEYGSEGLDDFIKQECQKGGFFEEADAVCISDNYWLGTQKPCLTYGLRGCNYYSVVVEGPAQDLHSGVFGGTAQEPMTDLVRVLGTLVNTDGKIQIPGVNEMVAPVTEEEKALYGAISYTMDDLHESLGSQTTMQDTKEQTLMARWRYPTLSVHGVEGAFSAPGAKTVIPAKVTGKFSIRTVPDMESDKVDEAVFKHVRSEFQKFGSKNKLNVSLQHAGPWWVASPKHWNFSAAGKAVQKVFGVAPDLTREGGRYVFFPPDFRSCNIRIGRRRLTVTAASPSQSPSSKPRAKTSSCCPWAAPLTRPIPSMRSWIGGTISRARSCWARIYTTWPRNQWRMVDEM